MKCIAICRYSPRPDQDTSDANERQLDLIREWCAREGHELVAVYEDRAKSRDDLERPGLWDAVAACQPGMILVAYALDRIGDSVAVELVSRAITKRKAKLATVVGGVESDSPERQLVRTVLGAIAVYQKQIAAARTRSVMRRRADAGDKMGGVPPAGKMLDPANPKRWIDCPEEQAVLKLIAEASAKGYKSQKITSVLRKQGVQFRGKPMGRSTIEKVLARSARREA